MDSWYCMGYCVDCYVLLIWHNHDIWSSYLFWLTLYLRELKILFVLTSMSMTCTCSLYGWLMCLFILKCLVIHLSLMQAMSATYCFCIVCFLKQRLVKLGICIKMVHFSNTFKSGKWWDARILTFHVNRKLKCWKDSWGKMSGDPKYQNGNSDFTLYLSCRRCRHLQ